MEQATQSNLRVARLIAGALAGGVALFWIVGWVMTRGGQVGLSPEAFAPGLAFWIWAAVALPGFAAALFFRGRALRVAEDAARGGTGPSIDRTGEVQTNLVISWALLEGPALMSAVFFLLFASERILWAAVPVYAIGVAVTFPRAEWFGADRGLIRHG